MVSYKLIYLDGKGRAEVIRFIFAQAGVKYEDVRYNWEKEWPKHKQEMPYFQCPVLEEDGKVLAQSEAISMYLAKKYGLAGTNDWEAAKVQELIGLANDIMTFSRPYFLEKDETKKKQLKGEFEKDRLIPIYKRLDELLAKNRSGFFVGKQVSAADFGMFHIYQWYGENFPDASKGLDHLNQWGQKIAALPAIKKYLETRPDTPF